MRTLLATIHNHDLLTVAGTYGYRPELPARAGTEAVGVVDAVGADVTNVRVGQRVVTGGTFGAWAEYFVANAAGLIPVPDGVADESAAQLVSMPFSAVSLLHSLDLKQGDWLVQNAANGAVGRMVAQIGAARGLNVIGLVRRPGRRRTPRPGIANVVATDAPGWRDEVAALTGGALIVARGSTRSAAPRRATCCRCSPRTAPSSCSARCSLRACRSPPPTSSTGN